MLVFLYIAFWLLVAAIWMMGFSAAAAADSVLWIYTKVRHGRSRRFYAFEWVWRWMATIHPTWRRAMPLRELRVAECRDLALDDITR